MANYEVSKIHIEKTDYYQIIPAASLITQYMENRILPQPFTIQYFFMSKYHFTPEECEGCPQKKGNCDKYGRCGKRLFSCF